MQCWWQTIVIGLLLLLAVCSAWLQFLQHRSRQRLRLDLRRWQWQRPYVGQTVWSLYASTDRISDNTAVDVHQIPFRWGIDIPRLQVNVHVCPGIVRVNRWKVVSTVSGATTNLAWCRLLFVFGALLWRIENDSYTMIEILQQSHIYCATRLVK